MSNIRLIPRLDIKGEYLIKGIRFEGLRKIGDPYTYAEKYYNEGADEIIYMDTVASLYGRNSLFDIVKKTTKNIFIPITVGGGIKTLIDVETALRSGAEKVAINTAAINNIDLISNVAKTFGSQCLVISIEAKQVDNNKWEVYTENGRQKTGINVMDWVYQIENEGAGEILLTSVDNEGTCNGYDIDLIKSVSSKSNIPVIASGGMGSIHHGIEVIEKGKADAIAMANILHYSKSTLNQIREHLAIKNIRVRKYV
tara:strand:+ start:10220 stop:10984 length:765 start_codon:yes stop_codon:yes gene_type:complete